MKNQYLFLSLLILLACSKHKDPGFTSMDGNWTYTTPDNKIRVTFTLAKNGSALEISNQQIEVNGSSGKAYAELSGITLPATVGTLHVNANDSKLVYPYSIDFHTGTASGDYKTIVFATASYTWPYGTDVHLTNVKVTRQQ